MSKHFEDDCPDTMNSLADDVSENLRKKHTFRDQVQANIAKSLINIGKNIDGVYADYEKDVKSIKNYDTDLIGKTHLTAVSNALAIMKSAMNLEIKRIAKEIE